MANASFENTAIIFDSTAYTWDATGELTPQTGQLIIAGHAPTVWTSDVTNIFPNTGELIITGFQPVITSLNRNLVPATGGLTIRGFSPTVRAKKNNNCQSDKVRLQRTIRTSDNTLFDLYSLISDRLSRYFEAFAICCINKNALLRILIDILDGHITKIDIVNATIISIVDRIIENIISCCPTVQIEYGAAFFNHVCESGVDTDFDFVFEATFGDHTCALTDQPLPDYTYEAVFDNFVCIYRDIELFNPDFEAEFISHVCALRDSETFRASFFATFQDFVCEQVSECGQYSVILCNTSDESCELTANAEWIDYECQIEEVIVTTTTTEAIATTTTEELIVTTTTEEVITTTTSEPVTTTTTLELITTTTTEVAITTTTTEEPITTTTTAVLSCENYGFLYNAFTIDNLSNVAPEGYRVATLADIVNLVDYLGGNTLAGGEMKSINLWQAPNTGATDSVDFSALPTGTRTELGAFVNILLKNNIWIDNR